MEQDNDTVVVLIADTAGWRLAESLDVDTAMTLIALASEDPGDWEEAMSVWPRYRTPAVCEFVSSVPLERATLDDGMKTLLSAEAFVVIDFREKRVLIGGEFMPVGRDEVFAMITDDSGEQHCPLSFHLPPWWELREGVTPAAVGEPRQTPIAKPHVDRDVLYGDAMLKDIAFRTIQTIESDDWKNSDVHKDQQARYPFTIAVHRQWLMTPREDLDGRIPRELLHGAKEWSDQVTWGQRMRFEDGGPMIAAPDDWEGHENAPMGSQEVYMYFDLCRELIGAAWNYLSKRCEPSGQPDDRAAPSPVATIEELVHFLRDVKNEWLEISFEGGSSPKFIIECDRRRVPRGAGVAIKGIGAVQTEQHIADCDCPICQMMSDGMFGVGFVGLDGHHLELDDEFAFSSHDTHAAWEEQQREYAEFNAKFNAEFNAEFNAKMERERAEREAVGDHEGIEVDPFASAWSGIHDDRPLPGDTSGHLKMAFMVAEIVSELERLDVSREVIRSLNETFADYRRSDDEQRPEQALQLKAILQTLADGHEELISKSADLQSRIDEADRAGTRLDDHPEAPF